MIAQLHCPWGTSMKRIAAAAVLILFALPAWATFQDGQDAYERGDYETAFEEWLPFAEQGLAKAQVRLGWMYNQGEGVPQDYAEAAKWYRLAADRHWGLAIARLNLGLLYEFGDGVPQDYVQAHMWFNLTVNAPHRYVAEQAIENAIKSRDIVEGKMTSSEIEEAQRLAREWLAAHSCPLACP